MKFIKRFLVILLILFLLAGAGVFVMVTYYKKELGTMLVENVRDNYGLDLKVGSISVSLFSNWPHASVKLKDVSVANGLHPSKTGPLLTAGSIALSFNMERMLHREFIVNYIALDDASINMVRNADGSKNFKFEKLPHDTSRSSGIRFEVNKIVMNHVFFHFRNEIRAQHVGVRLLDVTFHLKPYADGLRADIKGKTLVEELLFNERNGPFLKNARTFLNLQLTYLKPTNSICIYGPSSVEIEGHSYNVTSLVLLGENRKLALRVESTRLKAERVAAILTPKIRSILSNFEIKRPIDAKLLLVAQLDRREDPVIIADIIGNNCDLAIGKSKIPYSALNFRGRISSLDSTCQRGDMEQASIVFSPLEGKVYDFPFKGAVKVNNLAQPEITINAELLIEANKIPYEISKDLILKGSALAKIRYSGPTNKLTNQDFLKAPMKLNAWLTFKNLSYKEPDRPYVYTVNGKASMNNHDLQFENLQLKMDIADALVKGKAEGFVPYVFGQAKGFKASVSARTEHLDLNPLFVKKEELPAKNAENIEKPGTATSKKLPTQFEFNVNLLAKQLVFRRIEANNVKVELHYKENILDIHSASLNTCDGKILVKAKLENFAHMNADVIVQDVDVKKMFEQFENFGQDAVVSDNLQGNISLEARFRSELDEKLNLKPESMACDAKLKLMNGHLVNYEPVQSLSNFLFRNRDFNNVSFTELNETFKLRGYEMQIEELEIGSNVLNLYVLDGLYNFKGVSNVNILIPWSNLKKRGKNYIPKNTGESAENTKGVKLNFNGPNKKMKISLGHKEQSKHF